MLNNSHFVTGRREFFSIRFKKAFVSVVDGVNALLSKRCVLNTHREEKKQTRALAVLKNVFRMFPTLGSDSDAVGNAGSNRSGALDGFASLKRLKRAKKSEWQ